MQTNEAHQAHDVHDRCGCAARIGRLLMRPQGEIRRAALHAAWTVAVERAMQPVPGATVRDVVPRLVAQGVGQQVAVATWKNLVRAGALRPVGQMQALSDGRRLQAYCPTPQQGPGLAPRGSQGCAQDSAQRREQGIALAAVLRAWR